MARQPRQPQTARMSSGGRKPKIPQPQLSPPAQVVPADASQLESSPVHNTPIPINSTPQPPFQPTAADYQVSRDRAKELILLAIKKNSAVTKLIIDRYQAEVEALARLPMEATSPPLDNYMSLDGYLRKYEARWYYAIHQHALGLLTALVDVTWECRVDGYYRVFGESFALSDIEWHCHEEELRKIDNAVPDVFGDLWCDKYL